MEVETNRLLDILNWDLNFYHLTDNKDCLSICLVNTESHKRKEKWKVIVKWVTKKLKTNGSIEKRETKTIKVNRAVQIECLVIPDIPSRVSIFLTS